MARCSECQGRRYRVATRDDGYIAIERCDACSWYGDDDPRTMSDSDAAEIARMDGIRCELIYPCYVLNDDGSQRRVL